MKKYRAYIAATAAALSAMTMPLQGCAVESDGIRTKGPDLKLVSSNDPGCIDARNKTLDLRRLLRLRTQNYLWAVAVDCLQRVVYGGKEGLNDGHNILTNFRNEWERFIQKNQKDIESATKAEALACQGHEKEEDQKRRAACLGHSKNMIQIIDRLFFHADAFLTCMGNFDVAGAKAAFGNFKVAFLDYRDEGGRFERNECSKRLETNLEGNAQFHLKGMDKTIRNWRSVPQAPMPIPYVVPPLFGWPPAPGIIW